jgi:hypothetical protein
MSDEKETAKSEIAVAERFCQDGKMVLAWFALANAAVRALLHIADQVACVADNLLFGIERK